MRRITTAAKAYYRLPINYSLAANALKQLVGSECPPEAGAYRKSVATGYRIARENTNNGEEQHIYLNRLGLAMDYRPWTMDCLPPILNFLAFFKKYLAVMK